MADKRPLERVSFMHRGRVFVCVVVDRSAPETPGNAVWSVTVGGVKRDAFARSGTDTQKSVVARVVAWYERGVAE